MTNRTPSYPRESTDKLFPARAGNAVVLADKVVIPWIREVTVERITRNRFPSGEMQVPYETRLWMASRI